MLRWIIAWLLCLLIGAGIAFLWFSGVPQHKKPWFFFCTLGLPSIVFWTAFAMVLLPYETAYAFAEARNQHRGQWLRERIQHAQRPMCVLGTGYCLPFKTLRLDEALTGASQLTFQLPRGGGNQVAHSRFADDDLRFSVGGELASPVADLVHNDVSLQIDDPDVEGGEAVAAASKPVVSASRMIEKALEPVVPALRVLSSSVGMKTPAVRVVALAKEAEARVRDVREALLRLELPSFECLPVSEGLMVADAWLDAGEKRPLLVIAAAWYDTAPAGSTEGAVALLLAPDAFPLPSDIQVLARLHRPVEAQIEAWGDVLNNAMIWGAAAPASVMLAWLSGANSTDSTAWSTALKQAGLDHLTHREVQRQPDPIIGHAGAAGGWLSIAAAMESGVAGLHLIAHNACTVQAAVLHVNKDVLHVPSDS